MNLKNSKFFRRIQMLRHISKEKLRKEKDRKRLDSQLESAFCEPSGDFVYTHNDIIEVNNNDVPIDNDNKKRVDKQKLQAIIETQKRKFLTKQPGSQPPSINKENQKVNGLIQLNNVCYQVECHPKANKLKQNDSLDVMPSVRYVHFKLTITIFALKFKIKKLFSSIFDFDFVTHLQDSFLFNNIE